MARASKASSAGKKSAAKKSASKKGTAKKSSTQKGSAKKSTTKKTAAKSTTKATSNSKSKAASSAKSSTASKGGSKKSSKKARSPFNAKFLEKMRKLLQVERDTYARQAQQLRAEADSLVADLDPGDVQFDEESGEGDTIAVERGRDLALAAKALEMIDEIDHALAKFDDGTYGICEVSGEPIPEERLEAIPWAREKVEYKVGGFGRR